MNSLEEHLKELLKNGASIEFVKEVEFFEKNKENIRKEYGKQTYVAIQNQKIVGSGPDQFKLFHETIDKYPKAFIQSVWQSETPIIMDDFDIIKITPYNKINSHEVISKKLEDKISNEQDLELMIDIELTELDKEMEFFKEHIDEIKAKYGEKYVAIHNQEIIGHNPNKLDLFLELINKYKGKIFLITNINEYNRVTIMDGFEAKK